MLLFDHSRNTHRTYDTQHFRISQTAARSINQKEVTSAASSEFSAAVLRIIGSGDMSSLHKDGLSRIHDYLQESHISGIGKDMGPWA